MTYLSWAALHEGPTDQVYFQILIPALMEDIVRKRGVRNVTIPLAASLVLGKSGREITSVGQEICSEREAFYILFIHADTGGRALEANMQHRSDAYREAAFTLCGFPLERCVIMAPRHETEAWMLADRNAVGEALGYNGDLNLLGLPSNAAEAERLIDPKLVLNQAIRQVRGRRAKPSAKQIIPAIAQRQDLNKLRAANSFLKFESMLSKALISLGCIN